MLPKPCVINHPGRNPLPETGRQIIPRGVVFAASLVLLLAEFTGCTTFHNGFTAATNNGAWNETVVVLRNRSMSAKAWHRRKHNFCREKYMKDFCAGFRAGYEEVAGGSDGCTPAFPPKEYWNWEFQSAEGHNRSSAWFAGYPQGARAAEEEGVGNWSQIQMSSGMQSEYQQVGTLEHQGALYPIPDAKNGYPINNGPINNGYGMPIETEYVPASPSDWVPGGLIAPVPTATPGS